MLRWCIFIPSKKNLARGLAVHSQLWTHLFYFILFTFFYFVHINIFYFILSYFIYFYLVYFLCVCLFVCIVFLHTSLLQLYMYKSATSPFSSSRQTNLPHWSSPRGGRSDWRVWGAKLDSESKSRTRKVLLDPARPVSPSTDQWGLLEECV